MRGSTKNFKKNTCNSAILGSQKHSSINRIHIKSFLKEGIDGKRNIFFHGKQGPGEEILNNKALEEIFNTKVLG